MLFKIVTKASSCKWLSAFVVYANIISFIGCDSTYANSSVVEEVIGVAGEEEVVENEKWKMKWGGANTIIGYRHRLGKVMGQVLWVGFFFS